jgi:hypothetical protein
MQFDYNGHIVRQSQPVKQIRTLKRTLIVDSRDRDPTKFVKVNGGASISDPGDYVVYLPRVYENIVSIRLKTAEITAPETTGFETAQLYILMSVEGLNKIDETAAGANRSGQVDSAFAKIPLTNTTINDLSGNTFVFYNDAGFSENITAYSPPIGRLDRLHITLRYHTTATSSVSAPINAPITFGSSENAFTFEIEYLDNGFNNVSTFETRLNA